jgi:hypothetical protein
VCIITLCFSYGIQNIKLYQNLFMKMNLDSSVSKVAMDRMVEIQFPEAAGDYPLPPYLVQLWSPLSLLSNHY